MAGTSVVGTERGRRLARRPGRQPLRGHGAVERARPGVGRRRADRGERAQRHPQRPVRITVGGTDVTSAFAPGDDGTLTGVVEGLADGENTLRVESGNRRAQGRPEPPRSPWSTTPSAGPSSRDPSSPSSARRPGGASTADPPRPAAGRQPGQRRHPRRRRGPRRQLSAGRPRLPDRGRPDRRVEQGLCGRHPPRLRVPVGDRRRVPLARRPGGTARRRGHDHHDGRPDGALHRALGAGHDQPLHLQRRHARPGRRGRPDRAGRLAVEPPPGVQLPGRRRHRPPPGHHQHGRCCPPTCWAGATA